LDQKQPLLLHGCCECSPELLARRHPKKKKDKKRSKYVALDFFEKTNPKKKDKKEANT
jgi:hypothetical protein